MHPVPVHVSAEVMVKWSFTPQMLNTPDLRWGAGLRLGLDETPQLMRIVGFHDDIPAFFILFFLVKDI